jgi:hypothetical protein
MSLRRRKIKAILPLLFGYVILGVPLLVSLYIFGTNMPRDLLLTLVGVTTLLFIVLSLAPIFFCLGASLWWGLVFSRFWWA